MRTARFQLVELIIPAATAGAGAQVNFDDQPLLRTQEGNRVYIQAIEVFAANALATMPSGNTVIPAAQLRNATLTLSVNNFFQIKQLPLVRQNVIYADPAAFFAYTPNIFEFENLSDVIWTESFVQFSASPAGAVPFSVLFGVHYDLKPRVNIS